MATYRQQVVRKPTKKIVKWRQLRIFEKIFQAIDCRNATHDFVKQPIQHTTIRLGRGLSWSLLLAGLGGSRVFGECA